ncbi:hypothetical protein WJX72_003572 [[Myrmecia] bisecta]|uniref:RING-type E3 ubiquitin transferase n=1 Tax=[Myrmecia] bisecta TaxID=41462 RepID=A0AAW1Q026_9CHLO
MARHEPRSADDWFFEVLNAELKLIDRQFESAARQLIKYFDKGQSLLLKPLLCCLPLASVALRAHPEELAEQAHWCQEYAKVNAMGLRKIVKKHDKVYGNKEGQKFLQACWMNGNHGPSLAEDTFRCSICLDLLYKPLGLTCGHVFCTPCALGAAGMRNALGTTHAILQHIKPRAACPECRRTGVYLEAVQLKRAGQLIQKRWPEDFAKREEEENARLADMRRKLQEQRAAANDGSWGFVLPY